LLIGPSSGINMYICRNQTIDFELGREHPKMSTLLAEVLN